MLYKNMLIKARVRELKKQLVVVTKRLRRKRKQVQIGRTLDFSVEALQVAKSSSTSYITLKKARSKGS